MKIIICFLTAIVCGRAVADCGNEYNLGRLRDLKHFHFDVSRLDETLRFIKNSRDHPALDRDPAWRTKFGKSPVVPNETRSDELRKKGGSSAFKEASQRFSYWQNYIFGSPDVISLIPSAQGFPESDVWFKATYFDPQFLEKAHIDFGSKKQEVLDFVLVHEIMHYVYDLFADRNGHLSCHGFPGYLLNDEKDPSADDDRLLLKAYKHAEIDALALRILGTHGVSGQPALEFLKSAYAAYGPKIPAKARIDPHVRISIMEGRFNP